MALKEKLIVPHGGSDTRVANVRVICSTSRDLDREVDQGRFSFELLYRLNVLPVTVLGLDQRLDDIEPLVRHVIARVTLENGLPIKQLTPSAMALLQAYHWPGNVDQLREVVERAVVLTDEVRLGPDAFPEVIEAMDCHSSEVPTTDPEAVNSHESIPDIPVVDGRWPTLADLEAEHIRETLIEARYNQAAAARMLAVPLATLLEKIRQHRIPLPQLRHEAYSRDE
jgi:DNA-binding NtrC family response regulator